MNFKAIRATVNLPSTTLYILLRVDISRGHAIKSCHVHAGWFDTDQMITSKLQETVSNLELYYTYTLDLNDNFSLPWFCL